MELSFDIRGNLKPYGIVEMALPEFAYHFVESFDPDSNRAGIYSNYEKYLADLSELLKYEFCQWIDGSFTTTKKNPDDIDLVSFIDYRDFETSRSVIESRFSSRNAREIYKVDAYIVLQYPEGHSKFTLFRSDMLYWKNHFGRTKINRAKKQFTKGFIQINF